MELDRVYNSDCLVGMKKIKDSSVSLILQDPPYNTTSCDWEWDIMTKIDEFWNEWWRILKDDGVIVMTASQPFTTDLINSQRKNFKYEWIWEKSMGGGFLLANKIPLKRHENILVFYKKPGTYNQQKTKGKAYSATNKSGGGMIGKDSAKVGGFKTVNNGDRCPTTVLQYKSETGLHPTQKPVSLFRYLIQTYSNKGDIVFDGFMGSGTTAVSAITEDRRYIGFELGRENYGIVQKRIKDANKLRGKK